MSLSGTLSGSTENQVADSLGLTRESRLIYIFCNTGQSKHSECSARVRWPFAMSVGPFGIASAACFAQLALFSLLSAACFALLACVFAGCGGNVQSVDCVLTA